MFQSKIPKKYWSYSVLHAIFLMNRILSTVLYKTSSYEVMFDSVHDLTHVKVFGCWRYALTLLNNRHKFDLRARKWAFLDKSHE